jgi:hypothetical protein
MSATFAAMGWRARWKRLHARVDLCAQDGVGAALNNSGANAGRLFGLIRGTSTTSMSWSQDHWLGIMLTTQQRWPRYSSTMCAGKNSSVPLKGRRTRARYGAAEFRTILDGPGGASSLWIRSASWPT